MNRLLNIYVYLLLVFSAYLAYLGIMWFSGLAVCLSFFGFLVLSGNTIKRAKNG